MADEKKDELNKDELEQVAGGQRMASPDGQRPPLLRPIEFHTPETDAPSAHESGVTLQRPDVWPPW